MALSKDKTKRLVLAFPLELVPELKELTKTMEMGSDSKLMKLAILEFMEKETGKDLSKYKTKSV